MPTLIIKALDCKRAVALADVALALTVDEREAQTLPPKLTLRSHERRIIEASVEFEGRVCLELVELATPSPHGDSLTISTDELPHGPDGGGLHRGRAELELGAGEYMLWYEVIPDGMDAAEFHASALSGISLRRALGRLGRGALTRREFDAALGSVLAYECRERISLLETMALHRGQDDGRGASASVSTWIRRHCNSWGEESAIPLVELPEGVPLAAFPFVAAWQPVRDEGSYVMAGTVTASQPSGQGSPQHHMTGDFSFELVPSPAFSYMVAYTAEARPIEAAEGRARIRVPICRGEWESGSMPRQWRPEVGEYVTVWGRHVFDRGHMPMTTQLHPPHTIVRERTVTPPRHDAFERVIGRLNRAVVGMGMSGGFPGSLEAESNHGEHYERWEREFGGYLQSMGRKSRRCWPTNLHRHVLETKLFPPAPRPSEDAVLRGWIIDHKLIRMPEPSTHEFLDRCKGGARQTEFFELSFEDWDPGHMEFRPRTPRPLLLGRGDHFDLIVDLRSVDDIAAGFFAEIYCGWVAA